MRLEEMVVGSEWSLLQEMWFRVRCRSSWSPPAVFLLVWPALSLVWL